MKTQMTKKEIFCKAHEIARQTAEEAGSYRIAFKCALKDVYAGLYDAKKETVEEFVERCGCTIYTARNGEDRVYINNLGQLMALTGLHYEGTDGHLYSAEGQWFSRNSVSMFIGKVWYSLTSGCLKGYGFDFSSNTGKFLSNAIRSAFQACEG